MAQLEGDELRPKDIILPEQAEHELPMDDNLEGLWTILPGDMNARYWFVSTAIIRVPVSWRNDWECHIRLSPTNFVNTG